MTTNWLNIEDDYYFADEEEYHDTYFKDAKSSEFYYVVWQDEERESLMNVWFSPIVWWDEHKFVPDAPLFIQHLLPKYLKNPFQDWFWYCGKSKEEVEKDLTALGFVKNDKVKNW